MIGQVVVFLAFQRTYVSSNAVGVLLHYLFELSDPDAGCGDYAEGWGSGA